MASNLSECNKTWQYILVMSGDIQSALVKLEQIGWYHQGKEDEAKMTEMAQFTEKVAKDLRDRVEKLTGWEG